MVSTYSFALHQTYLENCMWQKLMLLQETRCLLTQSAVPTIWVSLTFSCKKQKIRLRRLKQLGIYLPQKKEKNPKVEDHGPWSSRLRQSGLMSPGIQFSSAQSLSRVQLFETPWTAAGQASLSISNSQSLLKLRSIELMRPSNHLILWRPLCLLPSVFPSITVFTIESVLPIR